MATYRRARSPSRGRATVHGPVHDRHAAAGSPDAGYVNVNAYENVNVNMAERQRRVVGREQRRTGCAARCLLAVVATACLLGGSALRALEAPWIGDVFFYWYTWDRTTETGAWLNGVHNTPLDGYYDSRTYADNLHSLRTAAEWGMTHHFMDYWSPDWTGEDGEMREKTVMRAAESLRGAGYDIWMSYYQDGKNFDVTDFTRNVSEKRDVYQWLRDFSRSPVWPRLGQRPIQLVYGRNGSPVPTTDHEAYRAWLRQRYPDLAALNQDWGTSFASFDDIRVNPTARGPERAAAIEFICESWRRNWAALDDLVKQEFGLPGMAASFDVGYGPYRNFGYLGLTRALCGPHSYGGIFADPTAQDTERYIQAQVAKHYDSVFFDHFKNYYHDWCIRVPGFAYLPDPYTFDRFWTGALMRRSEALLHLSWNEWWEGSNLEPSLEFGKTYCEKNLFYATLMKRCFPYLRSVHKQARIALVLNDYALRCGTRDAADLQHTVAALRRLNADFDLLPDDLVTAAELARFKAVIAPACGVGFGRNREGAPVLDLLLAWADAGGALLLSGEPALATRLGCVPATPPAAATPPGPDMNVFVDVGGEGDTEFLRTGFAYPENWAELPEGEFGAGLPQTVRWTPADGPATELFLPASPRRDHVLRLAGSAIWANRITVRVNDVDVGTLAVQPGQQEYEVPVPAAAVGDSGAVTLELVYAEQNVPGQKDPEHYKNEARVCNLALDWLQFSTANIRGHTPTPQFGRPTAQVEFTDPLYGPLAGTRVAVPVRSRPALSHPQARVTARYGSGRARELVLSHGKGRILYVNGSLADFAVTTPAAPDPVSDTDVTWWERVLAGFADCPAARFVSGRGVGGERLVAGETDFLFALRYDRDHTGSVTLSVPVRDVPLAEAMALFVDDVPYDPLLAERNGDRWTAERPLGYYGVFAFVHAPAALAAELFECVPGESRELPARVKNLTQTPLDLELELTSVIPTVKGRAVKAHLDPEASADVALPVTLAESADWGRKTVTVEMRWAGRTAYFVRRLVVQSLPNLRLSTLLEDDSRPRIEVRSEANPWGQVAAANNLRLTVAGQTLAFEDGAAAVTARYASLQTPGTAPVPTLQEAPVTLDYDVSPQPVDRGTRHITEQRTLPLLALPKALQRPVPDAVPLFVSNPGTQAFGPAVVERWVPHLDYGICDDAGRPLVSQAVGTPGREDAGATLLFPCVVPAGGVALYWLKAGPAAAAVPTDLTCEVAGTLGSGTATITVATSFYRVTIAEAAGGTVTSLVSRRTGREYARQSFDMNLGRFSAAEPDRVCYTTTALIKEEKQYLSTVPAKLKVESRGPLCVKVTAEALVAGATCATRYEFTAFSDAFSVVREVQFRGRERPEEIVVLDTDFAPNLLRKSYPGFAGILDEAPPQAHFGWRYSDCVPELISLISADGTGEAISLFAGDTSGIDRVRQGFWPDNRPTPGNRDSARIEYVSRRSFADRDPVGLSLGVRLHSGHHHDARQWLAAREAVQVAAIEAQTIDVPAAPAPPVDWWSAAWPIRVRFTAAKELVDGAGRARVRLDLSGAGAAGVAAESARLFEHHGGPLTERPCRLDAATGELVWAPDPQGDWPRTVDLYLRRPGQPSMAQPDWGDATIEPESVGATATERADWELVGAEFAPDAGRDGHAALVFANPGTLKTALVAIRRGLRLRPADEYRVRFDAQTADTGAVLCINIYARNGYDFKQIHTPLQADGQWHTYEVRLPTEPFPADITPRLRFWTMPGRYRVAVDRIAVLPEGPPPAPALAVPAAFEALPALTE
jgi:hypothetical protein